MFRLHSVTVPHFSLQITSFEKKLKAFFGSMFFLLICIKTEVRYVTTSQIARWHLYKNKTSNWKLSRWKTHKTQNDEKLISKNTERKCRLDKPVLYKMMIPHG